jgi:hypothetical protein
MSYRSRFVPSSARYHTVIKKSEPYSTQTAVSNFIYLLYFIFYLLYRLCCLEVRVLAYRSRGPVFDSRHIFRKIVGLEGGSFSFLRIITELLEWKISGSGLENRN